MRLLFSRGSLQSTVFITERVVLTTLLVKDQRSYLMQLAVHRIDAHRDAREDEHEDAQEDAD